MAETRLKRESDSNNSSKLKRKYSFSVKMLLVLITLAVIGIFGKQQWDKYQNRQILINWIEQSHLNAQYTDVVTSNLCPDSSLSKEQVLSLLVDGAFSLDESFRRTYCLKLLAEQYPKEAKEPLIRIALRSDDESVQATAIHLLTLLRDENVLPRLEPLLANEQTSESVKCAILDCIGFMQCPAYEIEGLHSLNTWLMGIEATTLDSTPRIMISKLAYSHVPRNEKGSNQKGKYNTSDIQALRDLEWTTHLYEKRSIPANYRKLLEREMLDSDSSAIRHSAARGLLTWPNEDYQLRVAEWGVWINVDGKFHLAQSVVDEIPEFVHSTGDDLASFTKRISVPIIINKPIMHITVDRPMSLDIDVRIEGGRTWFSSPIPDDYSIELGATKNVALNELNNPNASHLPSTGEGYPWLLPKHRQKSYGTALFSPNAEAINSVGLRWQSLIVTPEKLDGLELPKVSENPKHDWWKRLREVNSSYVANKYETEKFVYYDGPTTAESPFKIDNSLPQLTFTPQPLFQKTPSFSYQPPDASLQTERKAFFIQVTATEVKGSAFDLREKETFDFSESKKMDAVETRAAILAALLEAGLNDSEANGLLDCWTPQFFEMPGERVIFLLHRAEYDAMCPLKIRPDPTELERVGLVLTELGGE